MVKDNKIKTKKTVSHSKKSQKTEEWITKDMTLGEVAKNYPQTIPVMFKHGLHCIGCHVAAWETVEQGLTAHGLDEKQVLKVIKEMNDAIKQFKKLEK